MGQRTGSFSPGEMDGEVGGYIEGTLSVGSTHFEGCDIENGMILGSFRVKRKS